MSIQSQYVPGLEGIIAGRTAVSRVDGERGELLYRGYPIGSLVESSTFEEVACLLLSGELPGRNDIREFCRSLSDDRDIPEELTEIIKVLPGKSHPMDVLKIAVGVLETMDPDTPSNTHDADMRKAMRLIARIPTIIAAHYHTSQQREPVRPNPELPHAANFLYMLKGKEPDDFESSALDRSLILYADHEFNASTFAARVTASTLSDMHSSIISALGALEGPLHGGANERAMDMLIEIGETAQVESWVMDALSKKKRVMGFGHRVYKRKDARNQFIKGISRELSERLGERLWYDISQRVEDVMKREKGLHPNVDFYSASAYYLLGIPVPLYTPIFAASRIAGWAAHVMEQHSDNRLIRPKGEYIGSERRRYIPLVDRE